MLHIIGVEKDSVGGELGFKEGDIITAFNGEPVRDILDYFYYDGQESFTLTLKSGNIQTEYDIEKYADETLGLAFAEELTVRGCCNKCIFCFVDQLPKGMRKTLYVKDDDWRHSFVSGNYVTLTNLKHGEIERIINRQFSPVFISVHTTDAALRKHMLGCKQDADIMPLIKQLSGGGIEIHAQCVLCPGVNDGDAFAKTIADLSPYVSSLAAVPVGLTKFSNPEIKPFDTAASAAVLDIVDKAQKKCLNKYGTRKIFAADELYLKAGKDFPDVDEYEDFPQIENGVGMWVKFRDEVEDAAAKIRKKPLYEKVCIATGTAAYPLLCAAAGILESRCKISIEVFKIDNNFFGESVNVAGLITGKDLISQLKGKTDARCLMITKSMLREFEDVFLDGVTLQEAERELDMKIIPVYNDGSAFIKAITGEEV